MPKYPWRFQGDVAHGETDPLVTVFMGELQTDEETGDVSIRQDTSNPVRMRLSELANASHLADAGRMQQIAGKQKEDRAKAKADAEKATEQASKK